MHSDPIQKHPIDESRYELLRLIELSDPLVSQVEEVEIDILIGEDYYEDFMLPERYFLDNGMRLVNSKLGWILCGPVSDDISPNTYVNAAVGMLHCTTTEVRDQMQAFFHLGITRDPGRPTESK